LLGRLRWGGAGDFLCARRGSRCPACGVVNVREGLSQPFTPSPAVCLTWSVGRPGVAAKDCLCYQSGLPLPFSSSAVGACVLAVCAPWPPPRPRLNYARPVYFYTQHIHVAGIIFWAASCVLCIDFVNNVTGRRRALVRARTCSCRNTCRQSRTPFFATDRPASPAHVFRLPSLGMLTDT
jgi:hypothetical protein